MTLLSVKTHFEQERGPLTPGGSAAVHDPAQVHQAPRIGPNSVAQTLRALRELEPPECAVRVAALAGLPEPLPEGMIPEAWFVQLIQALRAELPAGRSEAVLRRSGTYTAAYVGQRRIPAPVRGLLAVLPARLALPLLLAAFRRHAWTFAGAGTFTVEGGFPGTILLDGCPTCRTGSARSLGGQAGAYYEAAFEGLLQLAARGVRVREIACQADGAPRCRFQLSVHPSAEPLSKPVSEPSPVPPAK
jgi:divinyl protochlorophyllide a 8-vinyl-reductase